MAVVGKRCLWRLGQRLALGIALLGLGLLLLQYSPLTSSRSPAAAAPHIQPPFQPPSQQQQHAPQPQPQPRAGPLPAGQREPQPPLPPVRVGSLEQLLLPASEVPAAMELRSLRLSLRLRRGLPVGATERLHSLAGRLLPLDYGPQAALLTAATLELEQLQQAGGRRLPLLPPLFELGLGRQGGLLSQQCVLRRLQLHSWGREQEQQLRRAEQQPLGLGAVVVAGLTADFRCGDLFEVEWAAVLPRIDSAYLRITTLLRRLPSAAGIQAGFLVTLQVSSQGVMSSGRVRGVPWIHRDLGFYAGMEHPFALNGRLEDDHSVAVCGITGLPPLEVGEVSFDYTTVVGTFPEPESLWRYFYEYLSEVRASPTRPFLHYNSWFDFYSWQEPDRSFANRAMDEKMCLNRVDSIGEELVNKRGVQLDSFLWDDGWDDPESLWHFHSGFPRGFTPVADQAAKYGAGVGVWVSPWGGYGEAKAARLAHGRRNGFETNSEGFSLSGPKYFARFSAITLDMVQNLGVNMFKFDGISFGDGSVTDYVTELNGMLRFLRQLRRSAKKDLWLNLTTGMWPSPFWLLFGDSIWRGFGDLGLHGSGSLRQQWITYRDAVVYKLVVSRSALFPLSALMLHGIVIGAVGESRHLTLDRVPVIGHLSEEVWSYFAMGVQLQELYISPDKMSPEAYDVLAEGAKWARLRAESLQYSTWIGGDAVELENYGFASCSPKSHEANWLLRNPNNQTQQTVLSFGSAFSLPPDKSKGSWVFRASCRYSNGGESGCLAALSQQDAQKYCNDRGCTFPVNVKLTWTLKGLQMLLFDGDIVEG